MSNVLYTRAKLKILQAGINFTVDDIRAILVDTSLYTFNRDTHEFLSDVAGGARVGSPIALGSKSLTLITNAVEFDAADVIFPTVTGATVEAVVLYKHNASDAAAALIAYIDTATGLPATPAGTNITVSWPNGVGKIFQF